MRLNVYSDPWIECKLTDGKTTRYGIRDCLINAGNIKDIGIPHTKAAAGRHQNIVYLHEVTPFVLMEMILARVFCPACEEDKLDIWEQRKFDIDAVDRYIQECEEKGISFDIFDAKRPFLQALTADIKKREIKKRSLGAIQPTFPASNTIVFYNHGPVPEDVNPEDMQSLTPEEYTAAVIRSQWCRVACGAGYIASGCLSGEPPLFVVAKGRNLFETLLLSLHVEPSADLRKNDRPMWEWGNYNIPVAELITENRFGYLASMLNPVTYLHYGDIEDGMIRNVYIKPIKFTNPGEKPQQFTERFLQLSTNYCIRIQQGKKDEPEYLQALHQNLVDIPWFSLAAMCMDAPYVGKTFTSLEAVKCIQALRSEELIEKDEWFTCDIYGLVMVTSTYHEATQSKTSVRLSEELLATRDGKNKLGELVMYLKKCSSSLEMALKELDKTMRGRAANAGENYAYRSSCERQGDLFLMNEADEAIKPGGYLSRIVTGTPLEDIEKQIADDAMDAFSAIRVPTRYLVDLSIIRSNLYRRIRKPLKQSEP